jgi:hypothetical protein
MKDVDSKLFPLPLLLAGCAPFLANPPYRVTAADSHYAACKAVGGDQKREAHPKSPARRKPAQSDVSRQVDDILRRVRQVKPIRR